MTNELDIWQNDRSLSRGTRRQLGQMKAIADVVKAALEEENQTYQYTSQKVSETLASAEGKKQQHAGNLSDAKEVEYRHLTQGYLDDVLGILASQDRSLMREIERATGGKIDAHLLSSPNRKLLDW